MPARLLIIASYSGKFYSFPHFYSLALSFTQPLSHVFFLSLACFFFHGIAFKSANKHFFSADMHRSLQHCNKLKHFYHIFILPLTQSLARSYHRVILPFVVQPISYFSLPHYAYEGSTCKLLM